jgi:VWFA-related protein
MKSAYYLLPSPRDVIPCTVALWQFFAIGDVYMKRVCQAILFVFVGLCGVAQESSAPRVAIPLIANGPHHRPISVTVESLIITDQKILVTGASLLRGADLPVELGVLIDASNSQQYAHLGDILKAMNQFVVESVRGSEDRVFFLKFESTPQATGWLKKEQLQSTNVKVVIGGGTALYDALAMASKERMGPRDWRKPTRRVLILITDGEDNLSHTTRDEALSEALKAGAVIFTINTSSYEGTSKGETVMEQWANLTGGESFSRLSREDMPKAFASIRELINGMYYLSYVPPDPSRRAVHEVEVKPGPKQKVQLSYARNYLWNP